MFGQSKTVTPQKPVAMYGLIKLKSPVVAPDGKCYEIFTGRYSILKNDTLVGFSLCDDCTWILKMYGKNNSAVFFGCQVMNLVFIEEGEPIPTGANIYNYICK